MARRRSRSPQPRSLPRQPLAERRPAATQPARYSALADLPEPDALLDHPAYQRALRYLYGLSAAPRSAAAIRADHPRKLPRMRRLLALLGDPHRRFPSVLIAGTKGKGSTAAMLASILRASGHRVGRYTQPHLVSYRERIWVDGDYISAADVVALVDEVQPLVATAQRQYPDDGQFTTFDVGTALAFAHFARANLDVAVVEVGVGGAHDSTNVLEPLVSAITPVSADHLATLGPTLMDVARQKAGVMRPGRRAAVAEQPPEVAAVLDAAICASGTAAVRLGQDWHWEPAGMPAGANPFRVHGPGGDYPGLRLPLLGTHQRANATLAVATARLLAAEGYTLPDGAVAQGLASTAWPGRIQRVPGHPDVIVDGAHNAASAASLHDTIADCLPRRPTVLVLGCTEDKDVAAIVGALAPLAHFVVATQSHHSRAALATAVATVAAAAGLDTEFIPNLASALETAARRCPEDGVVIVAGSLFLAGEALEYLGTARSSPQTPPQV
jgi:dihydrofolate synthase / folylpolyglutamate synthase